MQWQVDCPISLWYWRWPIMWVVLEYNPRKSPVYLSRFHWGTQDTGQGLACRSLRGQGGWAGQGKMLPLSSQKQHNQGGDCQSWWRRGANNKEKVMNEVSCWESGNKSESRRFRGKAFCLEFIQDANVAVWYGYSPENVEATQDQVLVRNLLGQSREAEFQVAA